MFARIAAVEAVGGADLAVKRIGVGFLLVKLASKMAGGTLQAADSSAVVVSITFQSANVVPEIASVASGASNVSVKSGTSLKSKRLLVKMLCEKKIISNRFFIFTILKKN